MGGYDDYAMTAPERESRRRDLPCAGANAASAMAGLHPSRTWTLRAAAATGGDVLLAPKDAGGTAAIA